MNKITFLYQFIIGGKNFSKLMAEWVSELRHLKRLMCNGVKNITDIQLKLTKI